MNGKSIFSISVHQRNRGIESFRPKSLISFFCQPVRVLIFPNIIVRGNEKIEIMFGKGGGERECVCVACVRVCECACVQESAKES